MSGNVNTNLNANFDWKKYAKLYNEAEGNETIKGCVNLYIEKNNIDDSIDEVILSNSKKMKIFLNRMNNMLKTGGRECLILQKMPLVLMLI